LERLDALEIRLGADVKTRTLDPVFSFVDFEGVLGSEDEVFATAFGSGSAFERLSHLGFVSLNIGVPGLFGTYLHCLENRHCVPYRYSKFFSGTVSENGFDPRPVEYEYYVRDLGVDTTWRRDKIAARLFSSRVLKERNVGGATFRWFDSRALDEVLGQILTKDPLFLITD
jgi:aminoglycoside N3'-acetyltransferase